MAAVVLGDSAVSIEGTGEQGFPLHAPPAERAQLCSESLAWLLRPA